MAPGRIMRAILFLLASLAESTPLMAANEPSSPDALLDRSLAALGGYDAITKLTGLTYHAPNIYRSRSLMQSYELTRADTYVAMTGSQNISFHFSSDHLVQRIDRRFIPSVYWIWSSPELDAIDFSLVVRGGSDGFACFVRGNDQIWLPSDIASGYTDAALAEYLVLHGEMLSPELLLKIKSSNATSASNVDVNGIAMPAVHAPDMEMTVIFDPSSSLPYIIRTAEEHPVYGPSTNDLYLTNYTTVDGLMLPHHIQTVYNSSTQKLDATLEDFVVEQITLNPAFSSDFFDGLPDDKSFSPKAAPKKVDGVSHARITEFSSNMLWAGITKSTVEGLQVEQPIPELPTVHWVVLDNDTLGVKQFIIEFETELIVGDAPPQWTRSVIQWIAENLKKPVTHVWPTHHHRDHTGGTAEYVAAGAKLIVPEIAAKYWSSIPNATLVTFNDTHPYVHTDSKIQAWFMWQPEATHAADWSYSLVTARCPTSDSSVAVFEADVWQAGLPDGQSDQALMRQWLDQTQQNRLTDRAMVLPTHGQVTPLSTLVNITGYPYPAYSIMDWRNGEAKC